MTPDRITPARIKLALTILAAAFAAAAAAATTEANWQAVAFAALGAGLAAAAHVPRPGDAPKVGP